MEREILRTYSDLCMLSTFEQRFNYLYLGGRVGESTFGYDRIFNQMFYTSKEWRDIRRYVIIRDEAKDLGIGPLVNGRKIFIHHMNPIDINDIKDSTDILLNPEFLIVCSYETHQAIHYGKSNLILPNGERSPFDTCPWKK